MFQLVAEEEEEGVEAKDGPKQHPQHLGVCATAAAAAAAASTPKGGGGLLGEEFGDKK